MEDYIRTMLNTAGVIHAEVNQFFDDKPYVFHLKAVLENAMEYGKYFPEFEKYKYIIAFGACYHDTIEDARLTYNDVLKEACRFFENKDDALMATEIVYALTNEKGRNRAERANDKYYAGIKITPFASFVKFCDRLANTRYATENKSSMAKQYKKELPAFIGHLIDPTETNFMLGVPIKLIEDLKNL